MSTAIIHPLDELLQTAADFARDARAPRTFTAYAKAWKQFCGFSSRASCSRYQPHPRRCARGWPAGRRLA